MDHHHLPAIFIADAPALDFLNSIATPTGTQIDWIDPVKALETLRAQAMPGEFDSVAAQARSLREWFREFVRGHKGRPLTAEDLYQLEPLNRLLERDESFSQIVARDPGAVSSLEWRMMRRWRSSESLLLPIGEALAKFVCEEDFSNVKACEGRHCTLIFADHTRGHRRRWCSTAVCGNRAKVAAHRKRLKKAGAR